MTARIEAYLWSSGTTGDRDDLSTVEIVEAGPAARTVTLAQGGTLLSAALTSWQSLLNAAATGTYALTWSASAQGVTIAETAGPTAFDLVLADALEAATGLTSGTGATSYTGTNGNARVDSSDLGLHVKPPREPDTVELLRYRHGRARGIVRKSHDLCDVEIVALAATVARIVTGPCASGRVRVSPDTSVTTPRSATTPGGYVDGWVVGVGEVSVLGSSETYRRVTLTLALPRS